jgi:hypothetical protein
MSSTKFQLYKVTVAPSFKELQTAKYNVEDHLWFLLNKATDDTNLGHDAAILKTARLLVVLNAAYAFNASKPRPTTWQKYREQLPAIVKDSDDLFPPNMAARTWEQHYKELGALDDTARYGVLTGLTIPRNERNEDPTRIPRVPRPGRTTPPRAVSAPLGPPWASWTLLADPKRITVIDRLSTRIYNDHLVEDINKGNKLDYFTRLLIRGLQIVTGDQQEVFVDNLDLAQHILRAVAPSNQRANWSRREDTAIFPFLLHSAAPMAVAVYTKDHQTRQLTSITFHTPKQ